MSTFSTLMRRADMMRRIEIDPVRADWWTGYMRGLRRAHHGNGFGTEAEHELFHSAAESENLRRATLGRGYQAGLKLEPCDPPENL